MKKTLALWLGLWAAGSAGWAHGAASAGAEPFDFLFLDGNARAVGLGGAYTALATDANALLYNPAGLGRVTRHEVTMMHNSYVEGINHEYMGLALRQGLGLNLNYLSFGNIPRTTYASKDGALGKFRVDDLAVAAGYGHTFFGALSLGVAGKFIQETNDNVKASAFAGDAGVRLSAPQAPRFTLGAAIQNVGPDVRFIRDKEKLPLSGRVGAAYAFDSATVAVDLTKGRTDRLKAHAGVEVVLLKPMTMRLGFNGANDTDIGITGGVGWGWRSFSIDYAFAPYGDLGLTHRASVTFRWGGHDDGHEPSPEEDAPIPEKVEPRREPPPKVDWGTRTEAYVPKEAKPVKGEETAEGHFAKARRLIDAKQFAGARAELELAEAMLAPEDRRRVLYYERQGTIALAERDVRKAKGFYTEGLKLASSLGLSDLNVADAYVGLGQCLLAEGDAPYALKFFKKAFEVSPSLRTRQLIEQTERKIKR